MSEKQNPIVTKSKEIDLHQSIKNLDQYARTLHGKMGNEAVRHAVQPGYKQEWVYSKRNRRQEFVPVHHDGNYQEAVEHVTDAAAHETQLDKLKGRKVFKRQRKAAKLQAKADEATAKAMDHVTDAFETVERYSPGSVYFSANQVGADLKKVLRGVQNNFTHDLPERGDPSTRENARQALLKRKRGQTGSYLMLIDPIKEDDAYRERTKTEGASEELRQPFLDDFKSSAAALLELGFVDKGQTPDGYLPGGETRTPPQKSGSGTLRSYLPYDTSNEFHRILMHGYTDIEKPVVELAVVNRHRDDTVNLVGLAIRDKSQVEGFDRMQTYAQEQERRAQVA